MGRAARRQQERAERRQRTQPAPRGIPSAPASAPSVGGGQRGRGSFFKPRWVMDIISELRKVTWPSRAETMHLTIVVIVVSILFGILLGGADLIFSWLIEQTILR